MKLRLLPLLLAGALAASPVLAQESDAAARAEMDALREEMGRLARRMAELSAEFNQDRIEQITRRIELRGDRPMIGILMGGDDQGRLRINGVTPGGPAEQAGLRSGDLLLSIDGKPIEGTDAAARAANARQLLTGLEEGQEVRIGYQRDGRNAEARVKAEKRPAVFAFSSSGDLPGLGSFGDLQIALPAISAEIGRIAPFAATCAPGEDCAMPMLDMALRWRGLNLAAVDPKLGRYFGTERGVLVLQANDTLAGLEPGDVILAVDGQDVNSPREAMRVLGQHEVGESVRLDVQRDRRRRQVEVTVPERPQTLRLIAPPAPPAPPKPPAPSAAPPAPPAPPAPGGGLVLML